MDGERGGQAVEEVTPKQRLQLEFEQSTQQHLQTPLIDGKHFLICARRPSALLWVSSRYTMHPPQGKE